MVAYNTNFELTLEDIELIENALRNSKQALSAELIEAEDDPMRPGEEGRDLDASLKKISELLGRLHNQKQFYRPESGAYVGG